MTSPAWIAVALVAQVIVVGSQGEGVLSPRRLVGTGRQALKDQSSALQVDQGSISEVWKIRQLFFGVPAVVVAGLTEVELVQ